MAEIGNWTVEQCSTEGTTALTLIGTDLGYARWRDSLPSGEVYYTIQDGINREAGIGTFNGGNTITRDTITATLINNVYNDTNPTAISLSGASIVSCSLNKSAFDSLLPINGSKAMTGDLVINHGASPTITIESTSTGYPAYEIKDSSGVLRGVLFFDESSGNLTLRRMSAIGTTQTSLVLTSDGNIYPNAVAPTNDGHLTRKDYVDGLHALVPTLAGSNDFSGTTFKFSGTAFRIEQTDPRINLIADDANGNHLITMTDGSVTRGEIALYGTTGEVWLERSDSSGIQETRLTLDSDGITSTGKVNGASVHATNGATGTATSANTLTIVDGIITNIA